MKNPLFCVLVRVALGVLLALFVSPALLAEGSERLVDESFLARPSADDSVGLSEGSISLMPEEAQPLQKDSALLLASQQCDTSMTQQSIGLRWRQFCDSLNQGWMLLAALLLPGSGQIINQDYWKLPIFYGGMVGFSYCAYHFDREYRAMQSVGVPVDRQDALLYAHRVSAALMTRNVMIAGACISYATSVADALISHAPHRQSPTAALVSSALLPGLGQMYNRSFWKIPVIYAGLGYLISAAISNHKLYTRYERAYVAMADGDPNTIDEFNGEVPLQTLEYGSNYYRRYRDLSFIGVAVVYALNVIDAYVDAHLFYWNVNDDVVVRADPQLALSSFATGYGMVPALHVSVLF